MKNSVIKIKAPKLTHRIKYEEILFFLVLIVGVGLSIIQFIYNRNIFYDEAYVSYRLVTRDFSELMKTSGDLVLPMLFLTIQKLLTLIIPYTELALKIFPFASYFAALYFFIKLVKSIGLKQWVVVAAVAFFVFNLTTIRYATEIKQYMTDVFVASALFFYTLKDYVDFKKKALILSIGGVIAIFLSHIAVIVLATSATILLDRTHQEFKNLKYLLIIFAVWLSSFAINYFVFLNNAIAYDPAVKDWFMKQCFMPVDIFSEAFSSFFVLQYNEIFKSYFKFGEVGFFVLPVLIILGVINLLIKRKYDLLLLFFVPLFIHLTISAMQLYPIANRLILYMMPGFIIMIVSGLQFISELFKVQRHSISEIALMTIFPVFLLLSFPRSNYPFKINNIKESMRYIGQNQVEGDTVILYWRVTDIYRFYHATESDLAPLPYIFINHSYTKNVTGYNKKLKNQKGRKWLLHTNLTPNEHKDLKRQLKTMGAKILDEHVTWGSSAYLVQFDDIYKIRPKTKRDALQ